MNLFRNMKGFGKKKKVKEEDLISDLRPALEEINDSIKEFNVSRTKAFYEDYIVFPTKYPLRNADSIENHYHFMKDTRVNQYNTVLNQDLEDVPISRMPVVHKMLMDTRTILELQYLGPIEKRGEEPNPSLLKWQREVARELLYGSKLKHHSILHVHEYFTDVRKVSIVFDNFAGGTLSDELARRGQNNQQFNLKELADLSYQIIGALAPCARNAVVHNDVCMENIRVRFPGRLDKVKLSGFSKACLIDEYLPVIDNGVKYFYAPEVASSRLPVSASDVWSFGVMLLQIRLGGKWKREIERKKATDDRLRFVNFILGKIAAEHCVS